MAISSISMKVYHRQTWVWIFPSVEMPMYPIELNNDVLIANWSFANIRTVAFKEKSKRRPDTYNHFLLLFCILFKRLHSKRKLVLFNSLLRWGIGNQILWKYEKLCCNHLALQPYPSPLCSTVIHSTNSLPLKALLGNMTFCTIDKANVWQNSNRNLLSFLPLL